MDELPSPATRSAHRLVEILLVDDDPGDVQLVREAFEEGRLGNHLAVAADGEQALAFLRGAAPYAAEPRPDLILLDLNMPRKGGREVLAELKADPELVDIPVAIVTGNEAEGEILQAYNLAVACDITKPLDVTKLMIEICSIPRFQVTIVTDAPAV